jgi:ribosomal protein S6--L-glutamate ligase
MRLGILNWWPGELESVMLADHARSRGHFVHDFLLSDVSLHTGRGVGGVKANGVQVSTLDAVICRPHMPVENWRACVENLCLLGSVRDLRMFDSVSAHLGSVCKWTMLSMLNSAQIPVPPSCRVASIEDIVQAMQDWGPIVIKPSVGYGGIEVFRFMSPDEVRVQDVTLSDLFRRHGSLICQMYLRHEGDLRINIVGGVVIDSVVALTSGDAWKPNHGDEWGPTPGGNEVAVYTPASDEIAISLAAVEALGLKIAGVDLIRFEGKLVVIEVNCSPGWDGAKTPDQVRDGFTRSIVNLVESSV